MCVQTYIFYRDRGMITEDQFTDFLTKWVDTDAECSGYMENCGQGSTSKAKVENRVVIINEWFKSYVHQLNSNDIIEEVVNNVYECVGERIGA